jgi:hypothetical protein
MKPDYDKVERKVDVDDREAGKKARLTHLRPRKVMRMIAGRLQEPDKSTLAKYPKKD